MIRSNFKYLIFCLLLTHWSCSSNEELEIPYPDRACQILVPYSIIAEPGNNSVILFFGHRQVVVEQRKPCRPDLLEFYVSENAIDFRKVATVDPDSKSYIIDDLDNGTEYFIKMVNLNSEVEAVESPVLSVIAGEIPLPEVKQVIGLSSKNALEDIRLSPSKEKFIYLFNEDNWYLSSSSTFEIGNRIATNVVHANWHPTEESEVAFFESVLVDADSNMQASFVKTLKTLDLNSMDEKSLLSIPKLNDFQIRHFQYSLDGKNIYLLSNKDNGGTTDFERGFYNLWRINLETGKMIVLSDFLPLFFHLTHFVEDPKQPGNFYLIGGDIDNLNDIQYYNTKNRTMSPVLSINYLQWSLAIDPSGDHLLITTDKTGESEVWSYGLLSKQLRQITNSRDYTSPIRWQNLNWISENEFITPIIRGEEIQLAVFKI